MRKENFISSLIYGAQAREANTLPEPSGEIDAAVFERIRDKIAALAPGDKTAPLWAEINDVRDGANRVQLKEMMGLKVQAMPSPETAPVQTPFEKANGLLSKVTANLHERRAKLMADIARDSAELFEVNVVIEAFGNASSIIHVAEATKPGEAANDAELSAASFAALSEVKIED